MSEILPDKHKALNLFWLFLLTMGAFLIQGYHPFAEDAEIYLPGVEKILHPNLFPTGQEFFAAHASMTFFPNLIAFSIRITHLPMEVAYSRGICSPSFCCFSPAGSWPACSSRLRERDGVRSA